MSKNLPTTDQTAERRARLLPWSEVLKRCTAAAATSLKGDQWSWSDVEDCAAELAAEVCKRVELTAETPAGLTGRRGRLPRVRSDRPSAAPTVPGRYPERLPLKVVSMSFLTNHAANWREGRTAERRRDELETLNQRDLVTGGTAAQDIMAELEARAAELESIRPVTPYTAADRAADFLRRTGTVSATYGGNAWTAVYTAALGQGEHGRAQDAAETLSMSPAAHRKAVSRGLAELAERGTPEDYRRAVGSRLSAAENTVLPGMAELASRAGLRVLETRRAVDRTRRLDLDQWRANAAGKGGKLKRTAGRPLTRNEWMRGTSDQTLPASPAVVLYPVPPSCRAALKERRLRSRRVIWDGRTRAAWTAMYRTAGTVARWSNAARISRQTTYGRTLEDRRIRRMAAGVTLPPLELELPRYTAATADAMPRLTVTLPAKLTAAPHRVTRTTAKRVHVPARPDSPDYRYTWRDTSAAELPALHSLRTRPGRIPHDAPPSMRLIIRAASGRYRIMRRVRP